MYIPNIIPNYYNFQPPKSLVPTFPIMELDRVFHKNIVNVHIFQKRHAPHL